MKPDAKSPTLRVFPAYKWCVVAMLWSVCFFNYADRQAIYSVYPKLKEQFGFNNVQLGLIGSAFMWVYAFGAPVAGYIGDRLRRKDLILGGCIFWSAITVLTGWCARLSQFVTVRAFEGLGETFYQPASMSMLSDYHGPKTRSRALSFHQSSVYIGTIAGGWAGGWFAEKSDWRNCFYLSGAAGVLLAVVLYRFLREPPRGAAESAPQPVLEENTGPPLTPGETLWVIFRTPTALALMAAFLCANFVAAIFLVWTPTFLAEKFNFKPAAAGLSGSVYIHLASAMSVPLAGFAADFLARRFVGGRIATQAAGLLAGAVFIFVVGATVSVTTLLVTMAGFGICKGFYDSNIFASLYDVVEPRARASAAGIMNAAGWGGGSLGPLFLGMFAGHGGTQSEAAGMSAALAWCGAVYLLGATILIVTVMLFVRRDVKSVAAHASLS